TADDRKAFLVHAVLPEHRRDVLRDRDDLAERPVTKLRNPLRLRMVDAAGDRGRQARQCRSHSAQEIAAATAVAMYDIGLLPAHDLQEPPCKAEIEIAGGGDVIDLCAGLTRSQVDLGVR